MFVPFTKKKMNKRILHPRDYNIEEKKTIVPYIPEKDSIESIGFLTHFIEEAIFLFILSK